MITLLFLVVFHLRSEISLCFSRFSHTNLTILDVKKYEGKNYEQRKNL